MVIDLSSDNGPEDNFWGIGVKMVGEMFSNIVRTSVLSMAVSVGIAGVVSAATVTQLIHFDDRKGSGDYTTQDGNFSFDPANMQSSTLCADTTESSGNGDCVIESSNGVLTTMTRNLDTLAAAVAYDDKSALPEETADRNVADNKFFMLDSFYMLFTGTGADPNWFMVEAFDGAGASLGFEQYQINSTAYTNVSYYNTGLSTGLDLLVKGVGYVFDMTGIAAFQGNNLAKVTWSASTSAQLRLDCVVNSFDGSTSEPLSGFTGGCGLDDGGGTGGPPPVPLPAGLPLMLSALGIVAVVRRKSRKAA